MLRTSENPAILTPGIVSVAELGGTWWLAYTKPRFEKAFAWDMIRQGIGYFLPMRERVVFSGGRKRRVMLPLFSSYVFFCGTERDRYVALTTNRLSYTSEIADQETLIKELVRIEKALTSKLAVDSYPQLPEGAQCRITAGPMLGCEGVIMEKVDTKARMILEVTVLGQGVIVEIDADLLEPV